MTVATFGVNDGHTKSGYGTGAVGRIIESEHTRLVGEDLREELKSRGQNVINCTIDYARSTSESLALIVQQANRQDLTWFISIHFNAGGGRGVEVYTYEGRQYADAVQVCKNIAALGFVNRGVKSGTGLYVIKRTKAKSMLIEVCFVDTNDVDQYLKVGHKAVAKAIADALVQFSNYVTESTPQLKTWQLNYNGVLIETLQSELNSQFRANLTVDGFAGDETISKLTVTIRRGAKGNITYVIQRLLQMKGYSLGSYGADSSFGSSTESAVRAFQKDQGLSVDGIVGQATWKALLRK